MKAPGKYFDGVEAESGPYLDQRRVRDVLRLVLWQDYLVVADPNVVIADGETDDVIEEGLRLLDAPRCRKYLAK